MPQIAETEEEGDELPMEFDLPKNELYTAPENSHLLESGDPFLINH
jgi:hypothetical protein